jgi:cytoskeletal protein CcmA (bactofilin family)
MFGKKSGPKNTIDSLIGASTRIEGNMIFQGGLRIDGHVQGSIIALPDEPSMLVISEQARVDGEISAAHLVVNGTVNGPLIATELLELQPKARVRGNVQYRALEMHHGAIVDGTLAHTEEEVRPVPKLALANAS